MDDSVKKLCTDLQDVFTTNLVSADIEYNEVTITLAVQNLIEVMSQLSSAENFKFEQLIDLTAVDYLEYGVDEWNTETATSSGFSRGVEKSSFGRFTFDDAPLQRDLEGPTFCSCLSSFISNM